MSSLRAGRRLLTLVGFAFLAMCLCLLLVGLRLAGTSRELEEATKSARLYQSIYEKLLLGSMDLNLSLDVLRAKYQELLLESMKLNSSLQAWKARYEALLDAKESVWEALFPINIARLAASGVEEGLDLIYRAEKLDIPGLLQIDPLDERFTSPGDYKTPTYVNENVVNYFTGRFEWFKAGAWDYPDFTESGWLNYTATVERFDGVIQEEGGNLTATALNKEAWCETRGRYWGDTESSSHSYWYGGSGSTMVVDGFLVTLELSYNELFGTLGGHGFFLNPQYVIFTHDRNLTAILLPYGWGEMWV